MKVRQQSFQWFVVKTYAAPVGDCSHDYPNYRGMGGYNWPLDLLEDLEIEVPQCVFDFHRSYDKIRVFPEELEFSDVCADFEYASQYFVFCQQYLSDRPVFLFRLNLANSDEVTDPVTHEAGQFMGYDYCSADGAYSVIENEILGNRGIESRFLNDNFVFGSVTEIHKYLDFRETLDDFHQMEVIDSYSAVAIHLLATSARSTLVADRGHLSQTKACRIQEQRRDNPRSI